jgi:DNA phosphorothioation-associated putative methyltransferase
MVLQTRTGQGSLGKTVAQRLYVHVSALDRVDSELVANLREAERITCISHSERYNVVRFEPAASQVALLRYQDFSEDPFPGLKENWRVDLKTGEVGYRTYEDSLNPPILHRKELLLAEDHPRRAQDAALTEAAEAIGLFNYPTRFGYRRQWDCAGWWFRGQYA